MGADAADNNNNGAWGKGNTDADSSSWGDDNGWGNTGANGWGGASAPDRDASAPQPSEPPKSDRADRNNGFAMRPPDLNTRSRTGSTSGASSATIAVRSARAIVRARLKVPRDRRSIPRLAVLQSSSQPVTMTRRCRSLVRLRRFWTQLPHIGGQFTRSKIPPSLPPVMSCRVTSLTLSSDLRSSKGNHGRHSRSRSLSEHVIYLA